MKKKHAGPPISPINSQLITTPTNPLLVCSICRQILWKPAVCNACLEIFCESCIQYYVDTNSAKCVCGANFAKRTPTLKLVAQLGLLRVHCRFHKNGCGQVLEYGEVVSHEEACDFSDSALGIIVPGEEEEEEKGEEAKVCKDCGGMLALDARTGGPHKCVKALKSQIGALERENAQLRDLMSSMLETLTVHDHALFPAKDTTSSDCTPAEPPASIQPQTVAVSVYTSDGSQTKCKGCNTLCSAQAIECGKCRWKFEDYDPEHIEIHPGGLIYHKGFHEEGGKNVTDAVRSDKSFSRGIHKFTVEVTAGTIYDGFGVVPREDYERTGVNSKMIGFYSNYTSNMEMVEEYYNLKDNSPYEVTIDFDARKMTVKGGKIELHGDLQANKEYYVVFTFFCEMEMKVSQSFLFEPL